MTFKEMQKLMDFVRYAPEEERDEITQLILKASADDGKKNRTIQNSQVIEKGYIEFTKKEICQMPEEVRELFDHDYKIIKYRVHRGMYQTRFRRMNYAIEVASVNFDVMKKKFLQELLSQTMNKPNKTPLMKDYSKEWLDEKRYTLKDNTYHSYEGLIRTEIIPILGDYHLDKITRKDIQDMLFELIDRNKNRTAQKVKQLLGAIFSVAVEDYDFKSPMTKIVLPHYEVEKGTPLSKEEEKILVEFCKNNQHLYAVSAILVLLYTGMRIGELKTLTLGEKDGYNYIQCETEKVRHGYAKVFRKIPISPMLKKVLPYIDFEKAKNVARKTISDTFKKVFPNRHVHELRYTFISVAKSHKCLTELVMLWVGHQFDSDVKSSKVDRGYTQYSSEIYFGDINKIDYDL
jgi:integrase